MGVWGPTRRWSHSARNVASPTHPWLESPRAARGVTGNLGSASVFAGHAEATILELALVEEDGVRLPSRILHPCAARDDSRTPWPPGSSRRIAWCDDLIACQGRWPRGPERPRRRPHRRRIDRREQPEPACASIVLPRGPSEYLGRSHGRATWTWTRDCTVVPIPASGRFSAGPLNHHARIFQGGSRDQFISVSGSSAVMSSEESPHFRFRLAGAKPKASETWLYYRENSTGFQPAIRLLMIFDVAELSASRSARVRPEPSIVSVRD